MSCNNLKCLKHMARREFRLPVGFLLESELKCAVQKVGRTQISGQARRDTSDRQSSLNLDSSFKFCPAAARTTTFKTVLRAVPSSSSCSGPGPARRLACVGVGRRGVMLAGQDSERLKASSRTTGVPAVTRNDPRHGRERKSESRTGQGTGTRRGGGGGKAGLADGGVAGRGRVGLYGSRNAAPARHRDRPDSSSARAGAGAGGPTGPG